MTSSESQSGLNRSDGLSVWTNWVIEETQHKLASWFFHLCLYLLGLGWVDPNPNTLRSVRSPSNCPFICFTIGNSKNVLHMMKGNF